MAKTEQPKAAEGAAEGKPGGRKKLLLVALPVLLLAAGGGAWFMGLVPGLGAHAKTESAGEGGHGDGHGGGGAAPRAAAAPVFFDMPEVMTNLNAPGRRAAFIRLRSKLELSKPEDVAAVQQAMPRLLDLFQTYLREVRPEELRGSIGTHRLREELIARASLAAHPARVNDVLFTEMLVQ
ncbi:flagellar basal body-associated FliL family protein [Roseomonas sp. OT10]|uniref:flagellar basal body-associated FliL family protein n=1 Tax=Roseomonas cutis TaxID=2897332 RepID=UPI001E3A7353|nr:flagellar basal body-associated FliL family protein [Roseomonas sp. OT10]UFN48665.1 flagellar basal body-associated FliL family protein [Roseomonas sp. OT10]